MEQCYEGNENRLARYKATYLLTYLVKCNINKRSGIKGKPNLFTMITKLIEVFKIILWSKYQMLPKIINHFLKDSKPTFL